MNLSLMLLKSILVGFEDIKIRYREELVNNFKGGKFSIGQFLKYKKLLDLLKLSKVNPNLMKFINYKPKHYGVPSNVSGETLKDSGWLRMTLG